MSGILVDYTTIYDFMYYAILDENNLLTEKSKGKPLRNTKIVEFFYALILWDKIYYLEKRHSPSGMRRDFWFMKEKDIGIDLSNYKLECMTEVFFRGYWDEERINLANKELYNYYVQLNNIEGTTHFQLKSAISYMIWGSYYGVNVLMSPEKSDALKKYNVETDFFSRLDIINMVDREVSEYYKEVNSILGKEILKFKSPLFTDYILREANTIKDIMKVINEIKNQKNVIDFRKAMDAMDECLNNGNIIKFNEYLSIIPEIVNDITTTIKTKTFQVNLNISPGISFEKDIKYNKFRETKLHINFLSELVSFGVMQRCNATLRKKGLINRRYEGVYELLERTSKKRW